MKIITKARVRIRDIQTQIGTGLMAQNPDGFLEFQASVDGAKVAVEAGYVLEENILDDVAELIAPDTFALRDGLRALIDGDKAMALILLDRHFSQWPDAARTVEEVIRGTSATHPRQPSLLAA